ncbi:MAG: hypothetical protein HZA79_11140 [Sphingobacteriales bacterium]|nr:hypothetical protein [Sphingobacteriales bacterium]
MSDRESTTSSLIILFAVTGVSCFGFSLVIKILDGHHPELLVWTGIVASSLALLTLLVSLVHRPGAKKRKPHLAGKDKN